MLIYNYKKEFLGIDESDLKTLGFSDLSQLRAESADFADLFVKTPGFVHNFKHVHWIDFIACAESNEDSKVIIHAKNRNYRCILDIKSVYLVDNPSSKAYLINLVNLRELTHAENERISGDLLAKPAPDTATSSSAIFNTPEFSGDFSDDIVQDPYVTELDTTKEIREDVYKEYEEAPVIQTKSVKVSDTYKENDFKLEIKDETQDEQPEDNSYSYNPEVASAELGLPIDLIEEFIEDFINQAKEFKDDLYSSLENGEADNVKILSHKLKGVAANLRIEDAFEALSVVNLSSDYDEVKTNLDTLYMIIAKLSGDEIVVAPKIIQDIDVPQRITMAELADDDFLNQEMVSNSDELPEIIEKPKDKEPELEIKIEEPQIKENIPQKAEVEVEVEVEVEKDIKKHTIELEYSKSFVAKEIGIDKDSFNELFKDYINESQDLVNEILDAVKLNDSKSWLRSSVKLKGMSDNMRIHEFTPELETLIKTDDTDIAKEAIDIINAKLALISQLED